MGNNTVIDPPSGCSPESPFTVHVAPVPSDYLEGRDCRYGLVATHPVASLERALEVISSYVGSSHRDVRVKIAANENAGQPETYAQQVDWTFTMPNNTITFQRAEASFSSGPVVGGTEQAIFDGTGLEGSWFRLYAAIGQETNLEFQDLRIQDFTRAIYIKGSKDNPALWNGDNTVKNCVFYRLGNYWDASPRAPAYGAIQMVNSDRNRFESNIFAEIRNKDGSGVPMRALDLAHDSSENVIVWNEFYLVRENPIRARNYSNLNLIFSNCFTESGVARVYEEWFDETLGECYCWENELRWNTLDGTFLCDLLRVGQLKDVPEPGGCPDPPPGATQRIRTGGNILISPVTCSSCTYAP